MSSQRGNPNLETTAAQNKLFAPPFLLGLKAVERSETKSHPLCGWAKKLYKKAPFEVQ